MSLKLTPIDDSQVWHLVEYALAVQADICLKLVNNLEVLLNSPMSGELQENRSVTATILASRWTWVFELVFD